MPASERKAARTSQASLFRAASLVMPKMRPSSTRSITASGLGSQKTSARTNAARVTARTCRRHSCRNVVSGLSRSPTNKPPMVRANARGEEPGVWCALHVCKQGCCRLRRPPRGRLVKPHAIACSRGAAPGRTAGKGQDLIMLRAGFKPTLADGVSSSEAGPSRAK